MKRQKRWTPNKASPCLLGKLVQTESDLSLRRLLGWHVENVLEVCPSPTFSWGYEIRSPTGPHRSRKWPLKSVVVFCVPRTWTGAEGGFHEKERQPSVLASMRISYPTPFWASRGRKLWKNDWSFGPEGWRIRDGHRGWQKLGVAVSGVFESHQWQMCSDGPEPIWANDH